MSEKNASDIYTAVLGIDAPALLSPAEQFTFGTAWAGSGLGLRERRLTSLVCVAWNNDQPGMEALAYGALKSGDLTVQELLEWVLHFAIYCGWPKASAAEGAITAAYARLLAERGEEFAGFPPVDLQDMASTPADVRMREGRESFAEVNLIPAPEPRTYYTNSGILGFVFGHVWRRPGLTRRDRRFITIPAVMVEGARIPILNHVGTALESGDVKKSEMDEVVLLISAYSGFALGDATGQIAGEAWERIEAGGGWADVLRS